MMNRVTYIDIWGHHLPLCMTVGAQDRLSQELGMDAIQAFDRLAGSDNVTEAISVTAHTFAAMLYGGREHLRFMAKVTGEAAADVPEISPEMVQALLCPADLPTIQEAIVQAISNSYTQTVEAAQAKNEEKTTP